MFKIIGLIMIIFSSILYGFKLGLDLKKHNSQLKQLKKMMFLLRGEIEYGLCPIKEALSNVATRCNKEFADILNRIAKSNEMNFRDIWSESWDEGAKYLLLSPEEKNEIINLKNYLGTNDKNSEIKQIDIFLENIEANIRELNEIIPKKTRVYNCLSISFGIMLSIIIL